MIKLLMSCVPFIAIAFQVHSMVAPVSTVAASHEPASSAPPAKLGDILYAKINPAVVKIEVANGNNRELGSGAIVKGNLVTTCFHVVRSDGAITIRMSDKKTTYSAKVIAKNERRDLAVLKVSDAPALPDIPVGSGASKGDKVFAFGAPLGLQGAMSEGKVLELGFQGADILMDASIDQGSSGGPLINEAGEAVGTSCGVLKEDPSKGVTKPIDQVKELLGSAS